ncbi:MAG: hypothetical protein Q8R36_00250 [bacterium]|nr:hypothetical protein [bacterium]
MMITPNASVSLLTRVLTLSGLQAENIVHGKMILTVGAVSLKNLIVVLFIGKLTKRRQKRCY